MTAPFSSGRSPSLASSCGASTCHDASGAWWRAMSVEHDHRSNGGTAAHRIEPIVDVVERETLGDQLVELEFPFEIQLRQHRKIVPWPGATVARSDQPFFAHESPEPKR